MVGCCLLPLVTSCSPDEFDGADETRIPVLKDQDFQISVDQETNQMIATYTPPAGTYPIWIIDGSSYSTLGEVGYKNSEAGTHTVGLKLGNRNGFSQGTITKTFTFNETKIDYTSDFRKITGKEWRFANKEVAHLACGPAGTAGTEWWKASADEKKAFGMYDDRITFTADTRKGGTFTYNAGEDGLTYVNKGTNKWGTQAEDFDANVGNQTTTWSFEVYNWEDAEGNVTPQTYIQLAPNTAFPYISSNEQYENPKFRIETLTAKKLVLIYEPKDRSIAWRFIFTSEAAEKEWTGFDPNSDFNMWKNVQYTMSYYYAPGWVQIDNPGFEANGNDYYITLPQATSDQWQAQVAFKTTNISTSASNHYDFSCIINSDKDLNGATVKLVLDGDDNTFYFADRIDLKAGEDYIFWKSDMPGIDMERVNLFFDFGGCQADTHINISGIVLKNHADDDGTVPPGDVPVTPDTPTMDWDYNSNMKDVEADMAYWLKRLRTSAEKNDKSQLDLEALDRLTKGRPSFDFMDKEYTDGMVSEFQLGTWQNERLAVCRAATEIRDGVTLDLKWRILESNDEEKALKKQITADLHKGALLKRYKEAAQLNRYKPAISGTNTWVNNLVKENFPEWGKILASKIDMNYKVNYDAMHRPKSRYHAAVVMCEDQGYKVLHYIQLSQPYKGNGKYGDSAVRYGGMKWSEAVTLVK